MIMRCGNTTRHAMNNVNRRGRVKKPHIGHRAKESLHFANFVTHNYYETRVVPD
jgi:hypothetical protein